MTPRDGLAEILDASRDNLRVVLERRGAYARSSETAHVDFARYFAAGLVDGVPIRPEPIGVLQVPTGNIVASDPFYVMDADTHPFERTVPPGRYPVVAGLADLGPWGERVAFARLKLAETLPVAWELAATALTKDAFRNHYSVDAGLGLFADQAAAERFGRAQTRFSATNPSGNYYDEVLAPCFQAHGDNWCDHRPDAGSDLNVIIFASGLGDGLYPSYWGLSATRETVCLVTDFQMFDADGTILRAKG